MRKDNKIQIKDNLNFLKNKNVDKVIRNDEWLYWSGKMIKVNYKKKNQLRNFVISNKRIYNIGMDGVFGNLFHKLVRRAIPIDKIECVTYSLISNNFIVHVPSQYDYYFISPHKDDIVSYILHFQKEMEMPPIAIFFVNDINLYRFVKYEGHKQSKHPGMEAEKMGFE